ncbi:MAG: hypothetical protein K2R98_12140 [Gemmataceae bacterium]|nr:hypothetical protein [Gemmataceae bacterium]
MSPPVPPFWFKQRQAKLEPAGENTYRITAPNLGETFITIRQTDNGRWVAVLKQSADGPDTVVSEPRSENLADAWQAAFELYRETVIV